MLYLDYSRKEGQWIPNAFGGRENLDAVYFLKRFNEVCYERFPGIMTIAEESTAWPGVSRPTYLADSGSALNGIWAGCTTFSITCSLIRFTGGFFRETLPSPPSTPFSRSLSWCLGTMKVFIGKARRSRKSPGVAGQKFPIFRWFLSG